jgi:hypothetical protein
MWHDEWLRCSFRCCSSSQHNTTQHRFWHHRRRGSTQHINASCKRTHSSHPDSVWAVLASLLQGLEPTKQIATSLRHWLDARSCFRKLMYDMRQATYTHKEREREREMQGTCGQSIEMLKCTTDVGSGHHQSRQRYSAICGTANGKCRTGKGIDAHRLFAAHAKY